MLRVVVVARVVSGWEDLRWRMWSGACALAGSAWVLLNGSALPRVREACRAMKVDTYHGVWPFGGTLCAAWALQHLPTGWVTAGEGV